MSLTEDVINVVTLEAKDCPTSFVTVYSDRAEMSRLVSTELKSGRTDILVSGLTDNIDPQSVRVSGGKGNAVILEVSYNTRFKTDDDHKTEIDKNTKKKEDLEKKRSTLYEAQKRIEKENEWLEGWSNVIRNQSSIFNISDESFKQAASFISFYQERLETIDKGKLDISHQINEINEEIRKLVVEIGNATTSKTVNEVLIVTEAHEPTHVALSLSYLVSGATWKPCYDVRVITGESTLTLSYYGIISNNTKEDWINANLSLSTAQPSIAGAPPDLHTSFVSFKQPVYRRGGDYQLEDRYYAKTSVLSSNISPMLSDLPSYAYDLSSQPIEQLQTEATESITCSSFNIPREADILSDNKPHKVTINTIELNVEYSYTIIPKLDTNAYLKANVINNTKKIPFLAGEINVFMDNNFITKSNIRNVSPGESFALFLGQDNGIKVEYKPVKKMTETTGLLKRTSTMTVEHKTVITNNKSDSIFVVLYEQLPKSDISNLKVKLIEPNLEAEEDVVSLNSRNNLKWKFYVEPGAKESIPLVYVVEHPADKEVCFD